MSSTPPPRIQSLKIKAKLLQKAKRSAGRPIALKDAFELIARTSGFPSWREMKATLEVHELLRPARSSALWSVWYAKYEEAQAHLAAHGGYLLPYQKQFFICDDDYLRNLGLEPGDPDVDAVGRDWTNPKEGSAWQRLLGKIARAKLDPASLLPASLGAVRSIEPITKGLSGASVYAVTTDGGELVLRVHHGDRPSWRRTLGMYRLASDHGVAPRLAHVDEAAQASVSERIKGVSFGAALTDPATRNQALGSLTAQLRALQAIEPKGLATSDAVAFARTAFDEQSRRPGFPAWAQPLGDRLQDVAAVLGKDDRQVMSHCDLNPANIIWDGARAWLVDWEGGGLAHPYLDLATITTFLSLPDEMTLQLAAQLQGAPLDPRDQARFAAVRFMVRVVYGCVFLRLVPNLQAVPFKEPRETLPLRDCFARLGAGQLALDSASGQALVGAAFLAMALG